MKKQMSYKAKRSMIILAVIVILAIIASIGTYAFISGNDETQAMSQTNGTASDRAGQEVEQAQGDNNQGTAVQSDNNQSEEQRNDNDGQAEQIDVADATDDNNNDGTTTSANNQGTVNTGSDNGTTTTSTATTNTNTNTNAATTPTTQTVTTTEQVERTERLVGFRAARLASSIPTLSATFPTQGTTPEEDTTAPEYINMGIFNWTNDNDGDEDRTEDKKFATNGSHIRLFVTFPEMLATNPKVDIYGKDDKVVATFELKYNGVEFYYVEFDISPEWDLPEGKIKYKVYGYADEAGNVGRDLTEKDTLSKENPYVIFDKTAPGTGNEFDGFPLYILNISANTEEDIDKYPSHYQYIQNGKTLKVEANFTEMLDPYTTPVVTIGTGENTLTGNLVFREKLGDKYRYTVDIPFDNEKLQLQDGQRVDFTISNVRDIAGNYAEFNNDNVTQYYRNGVLVYDQVTYDATAPVADYLGILNVTHLRLNNNGANEVLDRATNGDEVRVNIRFAEPLTVEPKVKIGGVEQTAEYSEAMSKDTGYWYYSTDILLTEEMNLEDGVEIPFEVYGYEDAAGNEGATLNNDYEYINAKYEKVIYDVTAPTRTSADFYVVGKHDETLIVEVSDSKKEQYQFAKNGDTIVMNAQFKEKLANIPTFVLIDSAGNRINLNEQGEVLDRGLDKNTHCYLYQASYKIAEDEANLVEGLMTIEISNIYDQVGLGEGYVITKPSNSRMIYYDRTNPELRVKSDDEDGKDNNGNSYTIGNEPNYSKIAFKLHDNIALKEMVINGEVRTISDNIVTWSDANFERFMSEYVKPGENTVILRDWAGNETEPYTFNFDNKAPARVYSTVRLDEEKEKNPEIGEDKNKYYYVKNGDEFVFAMEFTEELKQPPTVTIAGRNVEMALNEKVKEEESKYLYEGKFTIPADEEKLEEGKLEIKVSNIVDFAGNVMDDTIQTPTSNWRIVVYDRTAPGTGEDGFPLFILNYRLDDKRPYTVIKDGEKLFIEANFTEKLAHNPKISLIRKDGTRTDAVEIPYVDMIGERYRYYVVLPFDAEDLQLENGDRINFEITDVEDKAGNTTTFNNDNVTSMKLDDGREYGQVYYDNRAPEYYSLEILNITHYEENEKIKKENEKIENEADKKELKDLKVATTGDRIRVLISFPADGEKLAVEPQLRINGIECGTIPYSEPTSTSMKRPYYLVDFTIADETDIDRHKIKLDEGKVYIEVYGYEDAAGNTISEPLTNDDIRNTNYTEVTYDVTPAQYTVLRLHNDTHLNNGGDLNVAKNDDSLRFGIHFNEKLSVEPTLVIEGSGPVESRTFTMTFRPDSSTTDYEYMADVKLTEEMGLPQGEVQFKVYGYEDAAGNVISEENALTEENINHETYSGVEYDSITPDNNIYSVSIANNTSNDRIGDKSYAKVGDSVWVYITFNEKLSVEPKFTIAGKPADIIQRVNGEPNNQVWYTYAASIKMTADMKEGPVKFTISGYKDLAGNGGKEINTTINSDTNMTFDKTPPQAEFEYSHNRSNPTNQTVLVKIKPAEDLLYVGDLKDNEWTENKDGTYQKEFYENIEDASITIYDLAGNTSTVKYTVDGIDTEAPTIHLEAPATFEVGYDTYTYPEAGSVTDNYDATRGLASAVDMNWYKVNNDGTETKVKAFEWGSKLTDRELGKYHITYQTKDKAGNIATADRYVTLKDTKGPEIKFNNGGDYEFNIGTDIYKYPEDLTVTDLRDGKMSVGNVNIAWYYLNEDGTKGDVAISKDFPWNTGLKSLVEQGIIKTGSKLWVEYWISDKAGNTGRTHRIVTFVDKTAPKMTLNGKNNIELNYEDDYEELGAKVTDNYDDTVEYLEPSYINGPEGRLDSLDIDTTKPGTYKVVYMTKDSSGNTAVDSKGHEFLIRKVVVKPQETTDDIETSSDETTDTNND